MAHRTDGEVRTAAGHLSPPPPCPPWRRTAAEYLCLQLARARLQWQQLRLWASDRRNFRRAGPVSVWALRHLRALPRCAGVLWFPHARGRAISCNHIVGNTGAPQHSAPNEDSESAPEHVQRWPARGATSIQASRS